MINDFQTTFLEMFNQYVLFIFEMGHLNILSSCSEMNELFSSDFQIIRPNDATWSW